MLFQTRHEPRMMHRAIRHSFGMSINLDQITPDMQRVLYEHLATARAIDGKDFRTIAALTRRGLIRSPSRFARPKYTIITRLGRATAAVLLGMEADALDVTTTFSGNEAESATRGGALMPHPALRPHQTTQEI